MLIINKLIKIDSIDIALKDISWVNNKFYIYVIKDAIIWFSWDIEDDNGDKVRLLKER